MSPMRQQKNKKIYSVLAALSKLSIWDAKLKSFHYADGFTSTKSKENCIIKELTKFLECSKELLLNLIKNMDLYP